VPRDTSDSGYCTSDAVTQTGTYLPAVSLSWGAHPPSVTMWTGVVDGSARPARRDRHPSVACGSLV